LRVEALVHGTGPLGPTHSFLTIHGSGVIAEAVKIGEDKKSVVIRLYEAFGTRSVARLQLALPVKAVRRTNMLENEAGEVELTADGDVSLILHPFEIVTLKVVL